nr:hypothetical protein JVH1_6841 [Rhodococcus sp. JVH1]
MRQPQHLLDRARRQTRFAASPLRDRTDPGSALLSKSRTPAPHRIRSHLTPSGYLGIGHPVARPQQCPRLDHLPVRQRRRPSHPPQLRPLFVTDRQRRCNHAHSIQNASLIHRRTTRGRSRRPSTHLVLRCCSAASAHTVSAGYVAGTEGRRRTGC